MLKSEANMKNLSRGEIKYSYGELLKKSVVVFLGAFLLGAVSAFLFIIKDLFL